MKPFNLAEARIAERNYCQEHINGRLRIIVLMILLCLFISGASFVCKAMIGGQVQQTTSRLADAQGRCADVKREMQAVNTSLTELKWQGQLAKESKRWLDVLNSAIARVPADTWLDSIKNTAATSTLEVSGRAASFDALTAFISALRCAGDFDEVRLESAKTADNVSATCVDFTLAVVLKNSAGAGATTEAAPANAAPAAAQPSTSPPAGEQPRQATNRVPNVQGSS